MTQENKIRLDFNKNANRTKLDFRLRKYRLKKYLW